MKRTITYSLLLSLVLLWAAPIQAMLVSKPVTELIEVLIKKAGQKAPSKAAVKALERAVVRYGDEALDVTRRSGLMLAETAARHGDEVYRLAVKFPDAAPLLAARADDLLPLIRRHGDAILKLESKAPGMADTATRYFAKDLPRLQNLSKQNYAKLMHVAPHAQDAATRKLLLSTVEKQGASFLERISSTKILTLGLSSSVILAATGAGTAFVTGAAISPDIVVAATQPISYSIASIIACGGLVSIAIFAFFWIRRLRKKEKQSG
jgi:hypothetical protein